MADARNKGDLTGFQALDIGTGSGVLAMAAVGLGAAGAVAIDNNPAALHEAGRNIALNGMQGKILLTSDSLNSQANNRFALVMANLRPPTVKQMLPAMERLSRPEAYWVLSGFRDDALEGIAAMLPAGNAKIRWKEKSCGWAGLIVVRKYPAQKA